MFSSLRRVPRWTVRDPPQDVASHSGFCGCVKLALVALAVSAGGCSTIIPGPVVADAAGPPYFKWREQHGPSPAPDPFDAGIKLAAGDIVYSSTVNGGLPEGNAYLPFITTQRIPLRFVSSGKALTDSESYFLFSTLLSARHADIRDFYTGRDDCRKQLSSSLKADEGKLWNKLLASMYVRRVPAEVGGAPHLRIYFVTEELEKYLLTLTNAIRCEGKPSTEVKHFLSEQTTKEQTSSELPTLEQPTLAIPFLGKPTRSIASSLFQYHAEGGGISPSTDYLQELDVSRTSASAVELAAVHADKLPGIERLWSLADWEASGICDREGQRATAVPTSAPRIARIRFHNATLLLPDSYAIEDDARADFQVQLEKGSLVRRLNGTRRSLFSSLGRSSLNSLTMADVSAVGWNDENGNRVWIPQCKGM